MKKMVFTLVCVVGLLTFASCGSTAPCGLSQKQDTKQPTIPTEIVVAETTVTCIG